MTFKDDVYAVCKSVEAEFEDWNFTSGSFKNKSLKYMDILVHPGFSFHSGCTAIQPAVHMRHKKAEKLYKSITGNGRPASLINFQQLTTLTHMPEHLRILASIYEYKSINVAEARIPGKYNNAEQMERQMLDVNESRAVLVAMMKDGIDFIAQHYDLSSEENFLRALPAKYEPRYKIYREFEMQDGVMLCLVHMLYGDFDFFEHYRSDSFETVYPKRTADLDKIAAALPELKRRYAQTGSVI